METNRKTWLTALSGLFIGLGILGAGLLLNHAIVHFKSSERVVEVKGLAEREVNADRVIWPIVYKEIGDDLQVLYQKINTKNKTILDYLQSRGIGTEEITIAPPSIVDMKAERYSNNTATYRYNVTSVITVSSSKVDTVRNIILAQSELLKKGIATVTEEYRYNTEYLFTGLNDIKPEMVEEATKNARLSAEKFARDSDSELGKIKRAWQGQFSINPRDENTPHIKTVRVVTTLQYYLND